MPALLGVEATRPDPNAPEMRIKDESWYAAAREMSYYLFRFFQDNELLRRRVVESLTDVDKVILMFSDFTPEGQDFIMSQAAERWKASFDRPGSKKAIWDVSYLERELQKSRRLRSKH
ncbi:MAG TPA: hypothetical protein VGH02_05650 [Rhizomicrobium sp.]